MRVEEKTSRHRHCRAGITPSHITHCCSKTGLQTFDVSSICARNIELSRVFQLHMVVSPVTSMWRPMWYHYTGKNADSGPDMTLCMRRGCSWMPNWHQSSSRLSFLLAIYFLILLLLFSFGLLCFVLQSYHVWYIVIVVALSCVATSPVFSVSATYRYYQWLYNFWILMWRDGCHTHCGHPKATLFKTASYFDDVILKNFE